MVVTGMVVGCGGGRGGVVNDNAHIDTVVAAVVVTCCGLGVICYRLALGVLSGRHDFTLLCDLLLDGWDTAAARLGPPFLHQGGVGVVRLLHQKWLVLNE